MKIALVCPGVGVFWRGYERVTRELFDLLKNKLNITLFKGGGQFNRREFVLPYLQRKWIMPFLGNDIGRARYLEQLSYAIFFLCPMVVGKYDIVHYINPELGNFLYHLRKVFRLKFKLIYTNGIGMEPAYCTRPDFLHQVSPVRFNRAINFGIPKEKMIMIPHGIHTNKFLIQTDKMRLRSKYKIPQNKVVVLSVAAINRGSKRVHYLVKEMAKLGKDYFLLVAGNMEDPSIKTLAEELLGNNFKFTYVPLDKIVELYRLSDIFTICSLIEGFCLTVVEAMSAKLPVVVHNNAHFKWLVQDERCLVDMREEGNLARKIRMMVNDPQLMQEIAETNYDNVRKRFDWSNLGEDYIKMYEIVYKN